MKKILKIMVICVLVVTGCSRISIDSAAFVDNIGGKTFETKEQRQVRQDTEHWQSGQALEHHSSVSDLKGHRQELQFQKWEKERYRDCRATSQRQIESRESDQDMYEKLKDMPIDEGLNSSTNKASLLQY